jgi:hypothetical protein
VRRTRCDSCVLLRVQLLLVRVPDVFVGTAAAPAAAAVENCCGGCCCCCAADDETPLATRDTHIYAELLHVKIAAVVCATEGKQARSLHLVNAAL